MKNNTLSTAVERPVFDGQHPIESGNYHIITKEILDLYGVINKWIKNRLPGGIVYGRPRLGKTRAIEYMRYYLKEEYGKEFPIFSILCSQHKPSENKFYTDMLREVGHGFYSQGKAEVKKERLINFFIEEAEKSNQGKIVLFIDEAHMLFEQDYNWLIDIYNQLDRKKINMTVILVGQEELKHQRSSFIVSKKNQIIGRFMVQEYKFSGIKSLQEMKICLDGYDFSSEYPADSGWSFTRYFFPEAYDNGYRLTNDAEVIFNSFQNLRLENNIKSEFEIPMQYFTLSINNCLSTYGANGKNVYWPSKMNWEQVIQDSGYLESEIYNI